MSGRAGQAEPGQQRAAHREDVERDHGAGGIGIGLGQCPDAQRHADEAPRKEGGDAAPVDMGPDRAGLLGGQDDVGQNDDRDEVERVRHEAGGGDDEAAKPKPE